MRKKVMMFLMLMMFFFVVEGMIVSIVIFCIMSDLLGVEFVSWVYVIYMFVIVVLILIYGKFVDLFGCKKVLLIGVIIFLVGFVFCGVVILME